MEPVVLFGLLQLVFCRSHGISGCFFLIWENKLRKMAWNFHKHKADLDLENAVLRLGHFYRGQWNYYSACQWYIEINKIFKKHI